ncbi:MAG TPA: hypothetical protein VHE53_04295 [Patescibacteria group bacterium]|nr:hypothetical protein [Patescibacteria group bacterium]
MPRKKSTKPKKTKKVKKINSFELALIGAACAVGIIGFIFYKAHPVVYHNYSLNIIFSK